MPIYEYKCAACSSISEYLVGAGKSEQIKCRDCGSTDLVRLLSIGCINLQGSLKNPGSTCCGREERCEIPPCTDGGSCKRDWTEL
jgi:putative FmdB family regulatory protein